MYEEPKCRLSVLNEQIKYREDVGDISDGHHTFNELYDHRIILYLCLLQHMGIEEQYTVGYPYYDTVYAYDVYWSDTHHDGYKLDGWLIVGCINNVTKEQISYHISDKYKYLLDQDDYVDKAPEWDGHSSEDVLDRLISWHFGKERVK